MTCAASTANNTAPMIINTCASTDGWLPSPTRFACVSRNLNELALAVGRRHMRRRGTEPRAAPSGDDEGGDATISFIAMGSRHRRPHCVDSCR